MSEGTRRLHIAGTAGRIDVQIDPALASTPALGKILIAHPHPLFGGTRDNKVVQTLARTFNALGFESWRPNFRGVGDSEGVYDEGHGETLDLLAIANQMGEGPLILAGFSFGCFVQAQVHAALTQQDRPVERLVLIAPAVSRFAIGRVPADTLVIHGEVDDVVSLPSVIDWARPQILPLVVVPGADHFFHRKLTIIKNLIVQAWGRPDLRVPVVPEE
jgi:uncharacterized protein